MKIGIDASRSRSGGAISHIKGILTELNPSKYQISEVHIWAPLSLLMDLDDREWLIKHSPKKINKNIFYQFFWQFFEFKKELIKYECSILFKTTASSVANFSPSITLSQDMLPFELKEMKRYGWSLGRLRLIFLRFIYQQVLRHSSGVIFLTEYASKRIQETTGKLENTIVIPHGVNNIFRQENYMRSNPLSLKKFNCVYVSAAAPYKHQWNVIEAISILRKKDINISITLIGGGSGRSQKKIDRAVNLFDQEKLFVKQLPFLKPDKVSAEIMRSDIFIFASSCENLPITLLEGMSSGLAIASSNYGPMPEVLQKGGTYFDPECPNSIAIGVELLVKDKNLRSKCIRASLSNSKFFSWNKCSTETFNFLSSFSKKY